jgi:hypothetical protein
MMSEALSMNGEMGHSYKTAVRKPEATRPFRRITRVYPEVSGLSRERRKQQQQQQQTLVEKQRKGLWQQNSLDWFTK